LKTHTIKNIADDGTVGERKLYFGSII